MTKKSSFLSLGINVTDRPCLVVGGGKIGTRKALTLLEAGAEVIVVSPEVSQLLQELATLGVIEWRQRSYEPSDLEGVFLCVSATSDALLNSNIGIEAESRRILCCVASSAKDSSILFPAIHVDQNITVAVHSNSQDYRRSKQIRDMLGACLSCKEDQRICANPAMIDEVCSGKR